jgi:hypothetical protein
MVRNLVHPVSYAEEHYRKRITSRYLRWQFDVVLRCRDWLAERNNKSLREHMKGRRHHLRVGDIMGNSTCVGCCQPLTSDVRSREHILPQWLANEVKEPDLALKHYLHDTEENSDELLRSHGLGTFVIKNVCAPCNNGWMSRLERRAKPVLLDLINMKASLLQLSIENRTTVSAWAIKTAFMIASAQKSIGPLPWHLFRGLAEQLENIPVECSVLAAQLPFLPKGFLYACPGDVLPQYQYPVSWRVGFSIHMLAFRGCVAALRGRKNGTHLRRATPDLAA